MTREQEKEFFEITNRPGEFTHHNGIFVTKVEDGAAETEVKVESCHINPLGTVHGGVLMTMMDQAAGTASASLAPKGATVCCDIHFLAAACGGKLHCRAEVERGGRYISVIRAAVRDESGTIVAEGTYTFSHPAAEK